MDTQDCTYSTSLLVPHIRTLKSEPPSKAKKIPLKIMAEFDNSNFTHYYYSETFFTEIIPHLRELVIHIFCSIFKISIEKEKIPCKDLYLML